MWLKVNATGEIVDASSDVKEQAEGKELIGIACTRFADAPSIYLSRCKKKASEGGEVPTLMSFGSRPVCSIMDYKPQPDGTCVGKIENTRGFGSPLKRTQAGLWCLKGNAGQRVAVGVEQGYQRRWLRAKGWAERNYGEFNVEDRGSARWAVSKAARRQRDLTISGNAHGGADSSF